jgi:hypothetical protein
MLVLGRDPQHRLLGRFVIHLIREGARDDASAQDR